MALIFETIKWRNFLSTGNDWNEITLNDAKTTLIIGDNGAGKSTILDALCFSLFGKPFRNIRKPQLLNSVNNKGLLVEVTFTSGKDRFMVTRGMKPNVFIIEKNGVLINQDAAMKDYQEVLEKYILKLNHKSFCQIIILGSASFVPFMQLPAAHRREIIEDMLDIQIFTVMNLLLKDKISTNNRNILDVDYKYELNNEKVRMHEDHLQSLLDNSMEMINEHIRKRDSITTDITSEKFIIEEKKADQANLISTTLNYDKLVKKTSEMNILKNKLNDKINRLNIETEFFQNHDNCPTCHQIIDDAFKRDAVNNNLGIIQETSQGVELISQKHEETERTVKSLKKVLEMVADINLDISIRSNKIKNLERSVTDINEQIDRISKKNTEYSSDNKMLKTLEKELAQIANEKKKLLELREIHKLSAAILKDSGIKSKIIKQYIPIINKLINKYLAAMDFFVQFEIDENFNETIKSRFRDVFSYSSFSEGEKSKIDLALLFTWRTISRLRNSSATNILILDEVFDGSLDSSSSDELLKILIELSNDSNIIVISHKTDQLLDKFDRVIRFEKKNNFSSIAEE